MVSMKDAVPQDVLQRSGFTRDGIVEVILVTCGADGSVNAAPMGVKLTGDLLEIRPYKTSETYRNLKLGGEAVINVTHDPYLFLATAFKDEVPGQPQMCANMSLQEADSCIYVEVQGEADFSDAQALFKAKPIKTVIKREHPIVFSRGRAEAIEAVIHATRVKAFQLQGRTDEVQTLTGKIAACAETVGRVSPENSPESRVINELRQMMKNWGVPL